MILSLLLHNNIHLSNLEYIHISSHFSQTVNVNKIDTIAAHTKSLFEKQFYGINIHVN